MRILLAHSFYRLSGGEDTYVRQQLELLRRNHDVSLFARQNTDLSNRVSAFARMTYSHSESLAAGEAIERFHPDVIHLHNAYPAMGPAMLLAAKRFRTPIVMTVHNYRLRCPNGYMFTEDNVCTRCEGGAYHNAILHHCFPETGQAAAYASTLWVHRFILRLERSISIFVCPSEFVHATMLRWRVSKGRLGLVRNFTPLVPHVELTPGDYGVYLGRLSPEKGIHTLLESLSLAGDPPFKIVGTGPSAEQASSLASSLRLSRTELIGALDREGVDRVLRKARFVVFPSLWNENAPMAALEAMARARPLVVSNVGGLSELSRDGRGYLCTPGDPRSLAHAILLLMNDSNACRSMGSAALAFARAELGPERHLSGLESVYMRATTESVADRGES